MGLVFKRTLVGSNWFVFGAIVVLALGAGVGGWYFSQGKGWFLGIDKAGIETVNQSGQIQIKVNSKVMRAHLVELGIHEQVKVVLTDEQQPHGGLRMPQGFSPIGTYGLTDEGDSYSISIQIDRKWLEGVTEDKRSASVSSVLLTYVWEGINPTAANDLRVNTANKIQQLVQNQVFVEVEL